MAPDLPEIGDSDIPKGGSDMKTAVIRIHTLAKSLGITKARVVGHDIGLMVRTRMPHSSPQKSRSSSLWTPSFLALPDGSSYNNDNLWLFDFACSVHRWRESQRGNSIAFL
jgi:hypothetical protein